MVFFPLPHDGPRPTAKVLVWRIRHRLGLAGATRRTNPACRRACAGLALSAAVSGRVDYRIERRGCHPRCFVDRSGSGCQQLRFAPLQSARLAVCMLKTRDRSPSAHMRRQGSIGARSCHRHRSPSRMSRRSPYSLLEFSPSQPRRRRRRKPSPPHRRHFAPTPPLRTEITRWLARLTSSAWRSVYYSDANAQRQILRLQEVRLGSPP